MLESIYSKVRGHAIALVVAGIAQISTANAGLIIDSFPKAAGDLGGNGVKLASIGSTVITDTGIASSDVLGGRRVTTLTLQSVSGTGNPDINLKIAGGSGKLEYKSSQGSDKKEADGSFDLFYNGVAGSLKFPLDFSSSAAVDIFLKNHVNPGNQFPTVFTVTLTDALNRTAAETIEQIGNVQSGVTLTFDSFLPQPSFDFSQVVSINVFVDPHGGTNLQLSQISTTATLYVPPKPPDVDPHTAGAPEPASLAIWGLMGLAAVAGCRRTRKTA